MNSWGERSEGSSVGTGDTDGGNEGYTDGDSEEIAGDEDIKCGSGDGWIEGASGGSAVLGGGFAVVVVVVLVVVVGFGVVVVLEGCA